jgi:hypothetical protein
VSVPQSPAGFWESLDTKVKVISGIIAAAAALFGLWTAYDKFTQDKLTCRFSGTAYLFGTSEPVAGAFIGYSPTRDQPPLGQMPQLVKLAETGGDGTYSADCGGVEDRDGAGSFEVLTYGGPNATLPGLPCIGPETVGFSAIRLRNRGEHTGINVRVKSC